MTRQREEERERGRERERERAEERAEAAGTHFTCFTSTKVQILTPEEQMAPLCVSEFLGCSRVLSGSVCGLKLLVHEALSYWCMRP